MTELPSGFEIIGDANTTIGELPEGFEIMSDSTPEVTKEPDIMDRVSGAFSGAKVGFEKAGVAGAILGGVAGAKTPEVGKALETQAKAEEVYGNVDNIYSKYSTLLKTAKGLWNEEDRVQASNDIYALRQEAVNELARKGFENAKFNEDGELTVEKDGAVIPVETSFLQDLYKSKLETGGAVAGYLGGSAIGSRLGPVGAIAGRYLGSATGAALGRGADILINQLDLIKKVDNKLLTDQMTEAGIFDLAAGVLGDIAIRPAIGTAKWLKSVYGQVVAGNIDGAYEHALTHYGVSDTQAKELVGLFEKLAGEVEGTEKEKVLKVLAMTRPGGESIAEKANVFDSKASANIAKQIFNRAQDLLTQTKSLSADNVQAIVKDGLDNYTTEVKTFYNKVKESSDEFTQGYQFDFEATGLQPLLAKIGAEIKDPVVEQRFAGLLTRINDITEGRTFKDLIDLRQVVNDVKFSSNTLSYSDKQTLDSVLGSIDQEISRAADTYIPNSKAWKDSWSLAKSEYSNMKKLENNVLYKAMTRPGLDEDRVVKLLSKYISAGDNTFFEVMEKLPKNVRSRVDGSVLNEMVEKYSAGQVGGNRAVHFGMLSNELKKARWTSPQAKQTVRTIHRMAEVFKNDVNLAKVTGNIEIPKFQSYLTTDPVVRIKYEFASRVFNYVKQLMPGDEANSLALIKNTARLMENPLSDKGIKDMMRAIPKETRTFREKLNFDEQLRGLRQEYAGRQAKIKELYGKEAPPRLVWKKSTEAKTRELDNVGDTLYATTKGTIAGDPTSAIMKDRTDDIISDFIWQSTSKSNDEIVEKAAKYMDNARFEKIINYTRGQLKAGEREANAAMLDKIVRREADLMIKRIQADFGVRLPKEEADKIIALKFKEMLSEVCQ